jgi:uncharacterized protein (PEP-CTERM system associated)
MVSTRRSHVGKWVVLSAGVVTPAWADVQFTPSIALSGIYVDNFNLTPPGTPKTGEWVGELDPSVQFRQQAPELVSALDYTLQALWFNNDTHMDSAHSNGRANVSWTPISNIFSIDGWASYVQQPIDPTQPTNEGNLFEVGNIANRLSAYLAPTLRNDFGGYSGMLRYAESTSLYSGVGGTNATVFQNSRTGTGTAELGSNDAERLFTWSVDGRSSLTTFQSAQAFRDDRTSAQAGWRALASLRLLASAGAETNILKDSTSGGLNAGFWAGGFQWSPSAHSTLEARAGHRFFGEAYSGRWTISSRLLSLQASYSEEPTTDAEADSLISFEPGEISVDTQAYFGVLRAINTYSPYIRKSLDATFAVTAQLTQLSLRYYDLRRRYLQTSLQGTDDSTHGGEITLTRQLTARDKLGLSARLAHADEISGFVYSDRRYAFDFSHQITPTLDGALQVVHLERNGTTQYRSDIYRLTLRKAF